jgi:NAD(P)-dependent dehydrogenase (short-subunit alcohol dehydrogenase family)
MPEPSVRRAPQVLGSAAGTLARAVRRTGRRLPGLKPSLEDAISGRTVLITGASSGIGRATALKLGAAGATVLDVARSADKLEDVRREIETAGGRAHAYRCDLTDEAGIDRLADEVISDHGGIDVLVNNAGRSIRRSIELSYDRPHDFRRTMELNYFAPVKLILRFLPAMRERKRGQIVNVSSMGVQTNVPRFSAYVASKAALDAFSRCVASEIVDDGVHVSTVYMPLVRTPMIEPTDLYRRFPALSPEEAADLIVQAIVERRKKVSTGFGRFSEVTYATAPMIQDAIVNTGYKLFPDSRAARGADAARPGAEAPEPETEPEHLTPEQRAFERATRGTHW